MDSQSWKLWLLKSDPVGLTKHIGKYLNLKWKTVVAEWYLGSIVFLKYSSFFWALLADWVWCLYLICFHTKYCFALIKFWKLKTYQEKICFINIKIVKIEQPTAWHLSSVETSFRFFKLEGKRSRCYSWIFFTYSKHIRVLLNQTLACVYIKVPKTLMFTFLFDLWIISPNITARPWAKIITVPYSERIICNILIKKQQYDELPQSTHYHHEDWTRSNLTASNSWTFQLCSWMFMSWKISPMDD